MAIYDWNEAPEWADRVVIGPITGIPYWANQNRRKSKETNAQYLNGLHIAQGWGVAELRPEPQFVPEKPIYTAKDIRNRPVYKQLKASAADAKTLTKLVKFYLYNLNNFGLPGYDFLTRTERIANSFMWGQGLGSLENWQDVSDGNLIQFDEIPNPPKAVKAKPAAKVEAPKPQAAVEKKPAPKRIGWWA